MPGQITCADEVAGTLLDLGVGTVFTVSGNQILAVMDALDRAGVRLVHARHETAAVYMAEAAARVTGRPGVALVTAGPGHTSMLTGMLNAAASETPVLVLSGSSPAAPPGQGAFQDIDQVALAAPIGWAGEVREPGEVVPLLRTAWGECQGAVPGASCLSLPVDVVAAPAEPARPSPATARTETVPDPSRVEQVAAMLAAARSPLVLLRPSLGRSTSAFAVSRLRASVDCRVVESPRGLADPGWRRGGDPLAGVDVVAVLGPIDFAAGFGVPLRGRQVAQVSSRRAELDAGRHQLGDDLVSVWADERAFLEVLAATLHHRLPAREPVAVPPATSPDRDLPLHPLQVCDAVRPLLRDDDVLVIEGGEFGQWARAGFADRLDQQLVNGKLGAIGGALPHAVGASLANPGRQVLAFTGDGAFGYCTAELETAVREGARVAVFVGNDSAWSAERHAQQRMFGADRAVATALSSCDYARVADGFGAAGFSARTVGELEAAVEKVLASDGPAVSCVDVTIRSVPSPAAGAV